MSKPKAETIHAISSSVTAVATVFTAVATVFIVIYGAREYSALKKIRRYEEMKSLDSRFNDEVAILEARARAAGLYPAPPLEEIDPLFSIFNFFENMAPAYDHGIITADDICYSFRDIILLYWCGWEDSIRKFRKSKQNVEYFSGFEKLANEMKIFNGDKCFDEITIKSYLEKERGVFKPPETQRRVVLNERGQERLGLRGLVVMEQVRPHSGGWSLARSSEGADFLIENSEIVRIESVENSQ